MKQITATPTATRYLTALPQHSVLFTGHPSRNGGIIIDDVSAG